MNFDLNFPILFSFSGEISSSSTTENASWILDSSVLGRIFGSEFNRNKGGGFGFFRKFFVGDTEIGTDIDDCLCGDNAWFLSSAQYELSLV